MSGHGLHADCRGRAGVGAHTQRSCFRALAQLWGLVPCRRTAGLCLPVTAGGPWPRQTFSCCERRGMLTAESDPGQVMAFSGVHLGQFQRNQSKEKDLRIKSQFLTLYMNCFCIFWQFKIMFPNTRLPGLALQWKHTFCTCLSFIFSGYPFSHCPRKLLGEQTSTSGSLLRTARAAW